MASKDYIKDKWFLDSCCTRHITNNHNSLIDYRSVNGKDKIDAACQDGTRNVIDIGNVRLMQMVDGKEVVLMSNDVAYVPSCRTNLIYLTLA